MRQILDWLRQNLRHWWQRAQFAVLSSLATPEQKRVQGQTDTQRHYNEVMARRR